MIHYHAVVKIMYKWGGAECEREVDDFIHGESLDTERMWALTVWMGALRLILIVERPTEVPWLCSTIQLTVTVSLSLCLCLRHLPSQSQSVSVFASVSELAGSVLFVSVSLSSLSQSLSLSLSLSL